MSRIAYILLCHKEPEAIVAQANRLTAAGDYIAIHFDASAEQASFDAIKLALSDNPNVTFARRRIKCGWGAWSLVQATLYSIKAAAAAFPKATHFYMISGDCMPTKSADYIHEFLDAQDADFIESFDFFAVTGSKPACAKSALSTGISLMNARKSGYFTNLLNCKKHWDLNENYLLIYAFGLAASGGVCGAKQLSPF